jgi:hypothetical protein
MKTVVITYQTDDENFLNEIETRGMTVMARAMWKKQLHLSDQEADTLEIAVRE